MDLGADRRSPGALLSERAELAATIVLSVAIVLTAWSAFEAAKWGGVQSIKLSEAGAARTESVRLDALAGQRRQLDVAVFMEWSAALADDVVASRVEVPSTSYAPDEGTRSGFLFTRIRPPLRLLIDEWLAANPTTSADAPGTPFELPGYRIDDAAEAEQLRLAADELAGEARAANQNGDNYVLTTVLFASVLFFAGVTTKVTSNLNRLLMLSMSIATLVIGVGIVLSLPIEI